MAQPKKQQNPVGNRNIPAPEPADPEQEGFFRDFTKLTEKVRGIIKRATNVSTPEGEALISAGEEREKMLKEADVALTEARSLAIKIHKRTAGNVDMKKLLRSELPEEIQSARKQNDDEVKAAERAAKDKKDFEKKEAAGMAELEMQDRFDRGAETDEDKRIIKARKEKEVNAELAERKGEVRKSMRQLEGGLAYVDADIDYGEYEKADNGIVVLESNLPVFEESLVEKEQELLRVNIDPNQDPFIIFFRGQLQQLKKSIEKLREKNTLKKQESLQRKAEKVGEVARGELRAVDGVVKIVQERQGGDQEYERRQRILQDHEAKTLEFLRRGSALTERAPEALDEVLSARKSLEELRRDIEEYKKLWRKEVSPAVPSKDSPEPGWGNLIKKFNGLTKGFLEGKGESDFGMYAVLDGQLKEKEREFGVDEESENKKKWEAEFPTFEMNIATIVNQVFDAMMLGGVERKAALELQQTALKSAEEVWRELRKSGSRLSEEDWMNKKLSKMRSDVDDLLLSAEKAGGIRTDSPNWFKFARDWVSSVIPVEQFWNPDSGLGNRALFLERFILAEMPKNDEEFLRIVSESQREDFLKYIQESNVCKGVIKNVRLEKRAARQEEERIEKQEQERRGNLRHPQLNVLRAFEGKMLADFRKAPFWKKFISEKAGNHLLKNDAEMLDEELEKIISDVPAFREAIAKLEGIRKDILVLEDVLLRGENPDATRDAGGIQRALNGYFQQGRAERNAWNNALNAESWTISKNKKKAQLQAIWEAGSLEDVPPILRDAIGEWVQARIRLDEAGEYVQWVLDANPDVARGMKIPQEFRVERDASVSTSGVAVIADAHVPAVVPDAAVATAVSAAPVMDVTAVARQEAERKAEIRKESVEKNWKEIRIMFMNDIFWNEGADHASMTWSGKMKKFLRLPVGATMSDEEGLRDDRKADFYRLAAFTDLADLLLRFEAIRMKYTEVFVAPAAAGAAPISPVSPITMGPPTGSLPLRPRVVPVNRPVRSFAPPVPAPVVEAAPVRPSVPPVQLPAPIARRKTEIVPPPQELDSLKNPNAYLGLPPAPVAVPRQVPRVDTSRAEALRASMSRPVVDTRRAAPVIENVPTPQNPAELRVSGWARSVRESVEKWFGNDAADIAVREVTGMPSDRERRGEAPSNTEAAYRTLGSVMSVVGSVFGFKAFADVPRYLTQSFCTTNERALLQADILDAMEKNSVAKQRAGSDPEASLRANAEAAQRTDRAIATSAYLTDAQKVEMRARVAELQVKYTERTRENVAARSKELANVLENAVQNRVTGWGAAKETANTALRVMAFADVPVGAVRGVTYGVMAFRDRFEQAATKNPEASFVGKVANVFRDTWAETWGKLTKQTNNFRERVTNVGDAMSTIATAVGMAAVTIGSLEEALPGLRMVAGGDAESEGVASLIAEGREKLQAMIDKVLPTYERLAKRTV